MLFQSLSHEEKVDFFVKCQELLIEYHPDSQFIFREGEVEERLLFFNDFRKKYQGFAYSNDSMCLLFNKIYIRDANNIITDVKSKMFQPPDEGFNCYMIDWVVFKDLKDIGEFVLKEGCPQVKWVAWAKNQDIKIYEVNKFLPELERLKKIPKIQWTKNY